jgi:hypothetical protein
MAQRILARYHNFQRRSNGTATRHPLKKEFHNSIDTLHDLPMTCSIGARLIIKPEGR